MAEIDSLRDVYLNATDDTLRLDAFTNMAQRYRYINTDSAKYYLRKAIAEHKLKNIAGESQAFAYNVIGNIYSLEPNIDSAKYYYEEAYQLFINYEDHKPLLAIIPPYGNVLVSNNEAERGIQMFQDAIELAKEHKDYNSLCFLYLNLGHVFYNIQKDNTKALDFFLKGVETSQLITNNPKYSRISTYFNLNISHIHLAEGRIDSAIVSCNKAIKYGNEANLYQEVGTAYNNLTKCYIHVKQFKKAKEYNLQAKALNQKTNSFYALLQSKILAQTIDLALGNYSKCINNGEKILGEEAKKLKSSMKADIYNNLCNCYIKTGDLNNTLRTKDSLLYHSNKVYKTKHEELLAIAYNEYQSKEQIAENKLLKIKRKADEKQLRVQKFAAFGLLAALIFALALVVVIYRANLQKNKYNEHLEETVDHRTKELQEANSDLVQTNFELRTLSFIASHDIKEPIRNIGNFAGLIQRKMSKLERDELKMEFEEIKNSSKQLYTLIEDFTTYLSFSKDKKLPLETVDLNAIIQNIKTNLLTLDPKRSGKIVAQNLPLITSNNSAIYIILKNLIDNGLKYNKSKCPTVEISTVKTPNFLHIRIDDNGIGVPKEFRNQIFEIFKRLHNRSEYKGSGIGLSIVRLLSNKLGYKIDIEETPQNGCSFKLSIPMNRIKTEANKVQSMHGR